MKTAPAMSLKPRTYMGVLAVLGVAHLLNDFWQIGMITLTFQIAGSLLQPLVGFYTDRRPAPYSPVAGMVFTLSGLLGLAFAPSYEFILYAVRAPRRPAGAWSR
ncbi:hypothetical protein [Aurantimonas sp. C2-3-R2]|uniref:hypothetical protein n=1 Tax=unclassified Aurantimonas TaxID=2638230 RepID=UPI003FA4124D